MKRLLLAATLTLLTAGSAMAQTVVLVRHAEKADQSADPILSEAGQARAGALAEAVAPLQIDTIIVTPLRRTQLTAAPAAGGHVTPTVIAFEGGTPAHVAAVAARIRELPTTAKVLVVGHSNTIPLIAHALGFADATNMADCEYDRLTTLHLTAEGATGEVSQYGAPSICE